MKRYPVFFPRADICFLFRRQTTSVMIPWIEGIWAFIVCATFITSRHLVVRACKRLNEFELYAIIAHTSIGAPVTIFRMEIFLTYDTFFKHNRSSFLCLLEFQTESFYLVNDRFVERQLLAENRFQRVAGRTTFDPSLSKQAVPKHLVLVHYPDEIRWRHILDEAA